MRTRANDGWSRTLALSGAMLLLAGAHPRVQQSTESLSPAVLASLPLPVDGRTTFECGTPERIDRRIGLLQRVAIADNALLRYRYVPRIIEPNQTQDIRVVVEVVGDVPSLTFRKVDGSGFVAETWNRSTTRSVSGRLISVFDQTFPATILDSALRFFHGYDSPKVPLGDIEVPGSATPNPDGTLGQPQLSRIHVRLAPSNLPVSTVTQITVSPPSGAGALSLSAVQYASHRIDPDSGLHRRHW